MGQMHYLPLSAPFFAFLVGAFLVVLALIQIGILRYAYLRMGLSSVGEVLLLGSLIGSYINIPLANCRRRGAVRRVVNFSAWIPGAELVEGPGTVIAVNVGGAMIPGLMSIYLLVKYDLWMKGAIATAMVAAFIHRLATRSKGSASRCRCSCRRRTACRVLIAREYAAALAYVAGRLGTMIGADLPISTPRGLGASSPRSAAPGPSTASSSPASLRCCWRASPAGPDHTGNPGSGKRRRDQLGRYN